MQLGGLQTRLVPIMSKFHSFGILLEVKTELQDPFEIKGSKRNSFERAISKG